MARIITEAKPAIFTRSVPAREQRFALQLVSDGDHGSDPNTGRDHTTTDSQGRGRGNANTAKTPGSIPLTGTNDIQDYIQFLLDTGMIGD